MLNPQSEPVLANFEAIRDFCLANGREFERWPSYFNRRMLEFTSYAELFPVKSLGKVLELGCGVGYQSLMLAKLAKSVIATDLPSEDMLTHTPGMVQARKFIDSMGIKNIDLIGCSAQELPFDDNSFDFVYSSHVLEHIEDRKLAISEIFRVLKPGGIFFCAVPTSFEKVYSFINHYIYILKRILIHGYRFLVPGGSDRLNTNNHKSKPDKPGKSASQLLRYFLFPPPHGAYPGFWNEFILWTPKKWRKSITESSPFVLVRQQTTQWLPLLPLLGQLHPVLGTVLHAKTREFELKFGSAGFMQSVGINTVMIFKKSPESLMSNSEK